MSKLQERKVLKQKLFRIRRYIEGENVKLDKELRDLKEKYESLEGFTKWVDFPEKWDIGDPYSVKKGSATLTKTDAENVSRIRGKPYETIVHLKTQPKKQQEIEAMAVLQSKQREKMNKVMEERKKQELLNSVNYEIKVD
jgi:hypothetical protein